MNILALILGLLQIAPEIAQEIIQLVAHAKDQKNVQTAKALVSTAFTTKA